MTILTINKKELEKKIGKISKDTEEKITSMGTSLEDSNENEISVDVTPNRPDLLSMHGFARALSQYLGKGKIAKFKVNKEKYEVIVEKAVKKVRPFTVCAVVKNLKLDDEKIKEIIDIQEKLHLTLGRKRKKIAIGIYPLEKIKMPIRFTAKKPEEIKFIPLESDKEMNGRQILRQISAGRDYAHLLEDKETFPIFIDANNKIMSMPPIINSHETGKIDESTKEVFIECSGFNLPYLKKTLNIIVTALSDMHGDIYSVNVKDAESFDSPNLEEEKMKFKIEDINKTLGLKLGEKEIKELLEKMGIGYEQGIALVPAYRTDIIHWIDIAEEVAIAYGYDNFEEEIPKISTIAEEDKNSVKRKAISEILTGLDMLECLSLHLNKKEEIKNAYFDYKDFIEVQDSKTEYEVLRIDLLTNLLKIFSENSDASYPQRIFEIGKVFSKNEEKETGIEEKEKLSVALSSENANFTEIKQVLDYLFRMLGKEYKIEEAENINFIEGRCGKIIVNGKTAGFIGEISPRVLRNWKLKMPVSAFEIETYFI